MRQAVVVIFALSAVAVVPRSVQAQEELLREAQGMVERQEFEDAQDALMEVLRSGELEPSQVVEVYRGLAECAAALRRPDEARDAFISLLVIDPDYYVSSDESPLLREPFEQAQAHWAENERPAIEYQPPLGIADDEPFEIAIDLDSQTIPGLLDTSRLHLRRPDGRFAEREMRRGRVEIPSRVFEDSDTLQFYLSIHDEYGNTVAYVGTEDDPLTVEVGEARAAGEEDRPQGRRWYQSWWFWTIVGAVVVGVAVGVPVGLTTGGSEDPCEDALGGQCDLTVDLGL